MERYARHRILVQDYYIEPGGIPLLLSYAPAGGPRPLVLVLHGLGSHRSRNSLVPPNHFGLVEAGFVVASFDARAHGEREEPGWLDPQTGLPREGLPALLDVVLGTAEEVPLLLDLLVTHPVVDPARIGAIGVSMGALVLQHVLVREKRVRAAALVHSGAIWEAFRAFFPQADVQTQRRLEAVDPAGRGGSFYPTPLLLLNGADDAHFPPAVAAALLERLRPHYAPTPEHLARRTYPGVGHETVEAMRQDAIDWMVRFLKVRGGVSRAL